MNQYEMCEKPGETLFVWTPYTKIITLVTNTSGYRFVTRQVYGLTLEEKIVAAFEINIRFLF